MAERYDGTLGLILLLLLMATEVQAQAQLDQG